MSGPPQQQQINVGSMPMEQLQGLREQLQEEDRFLTTSYSQLRVAQSKFTESRESLKAISRDNAGTEIMVPITSSLYVKGTLADSDSVLVDVGTGYFVEKKVSDADEYLERKTAYLADNCERLEANIQEKRKNLEAVTMVMQARMNQMQGQQKQGPAQ